MNNISDTLSLPEEVLDFVPPGLDVVPAESVSIPYRYYQLCSVTFFNRPRVQQSDSRWQILGTLVFADGEHDDSLASRPLGSGGPPPLYEADPTSLENTWRVDLPQDCVAELLERLRETRRSTESTT